VRASEVERRVRILGPEGPTEITIVGVAELSSAGAYDNDAQKLRDGELDMATFDRRWAGKQIGDVILPSAAQVLTLARAGLATFDDFYPHRDAP
jgi:hypothetical protein